MADKKISALTALAQADVAVSTDVLPIVDTSATETKKVTPASIVGAGLAAGVTNVDINSGTIDGTTIATSDITVGSGKTLNVSAGTLTLADNQISGDKVEGGTINAITINTLTSTAVNATTVDTTNIEVTNIKAKDGTAAGSIADSTGVVTLGSSVLTTTDINGGTIDGTTIGGSSAAAGTFTTLTTSSTVTLNGGTANGVLYLNGSKVATSGTGLEFDGTNFGIGTGGNTINQRSVIYRGGANAVYHQVANGSTGLAASNGIRLGLTSAGVGELYSPTALISYIDNNEQMRLTSTGLGIGTSSPGVKLDVAGGIRSIVSGGTPAVYLNNGSTQHSIQNESGAFTFYNSGVLRATLDTSGNLGLGVTPSAWTSTYKAFALNSVNSSLSGFWDGTTAITTLATGGAVIGGAWTYTISGQAVTRYAQTGGGTHEWYTAPSGTAGNAITFTQALTLDANRNLLLNGTTAPASGVGTFAIFNGTAPTGSVTNGCVLYTEDVSSSSELKVRDEAGNVTTLSPHNFSLIPEGPSEDMAWSYYSERDGKRINIDMLRAIRVLEKLSGEKLVHES